MKKTTKFFFFTSLIALSFACENKSKKNDFSFEKGNFKTYLEDKKDSSFIYRTGNLQIETYRNTIDTFNIKWKNKFEFHLQKQHPKTHLDSLLFIVKITKIKNDFYEFEANYENSNFKQKGSTYKIN